MIIFDSSNACHFNIIDCDEIFKSNELPLSYFILSEPNKVNEWSQALKQRNRQIIMLFPKGLCVITLRCPKLLAIKQTYLRV